MTACGKRSLSIYCCGVVISYWIILASHAQQFGAIRYVLLNISGVGLLLLVGIGLQLFTDRESIPDRGREPALG